MNLEDLFREYWKIRFHTIPIEQRQYIVNKSHDNIYVQCSFLDPVFLDLKYSSITKRGVNARVKLNCTLCILT